MEIKKEAGLGRGPQVDRRELEQIHQFSRKELTAEEVYTFSVRLCDNEIDRDGERFSPQALETLAEKFVGKSGIFDHEWSARGQTARIYRAEVVREPEATTRAGDPLCYVKGYAYMLRTEANRDLIAEIDAGIKREVSVGCAVERSVCSVCGEDIRDREKCRHIRGRTYNGKLCWAELDGVTDAYEWSFVAVPAQPGAGVLKGFRGEARLERLEQEAALGRKYLAGLRRAGAGSTRPGAYDGKAGGGRAGGAAQGAGKTDPGALRPADAVDLFGRAGTGDGPGRGLPDLRQVGRRRKGGRA